MLGATERDGTHGTSGTPQIVGFHNWGTNAARPKGPINHTGEKIAYNIQPFALKPQYALITIEEAIMMKRKKKKRAPFFLVLTPGM